jgi:acyl-CoA reductase-like NAD-dependent aldehyde dehydrogenase
MSQHKLTLPGYQSTGNSWRQVVNPWNREPIAEVEMADDAAIAHAIVTARSTLESGWSDTPVYRRCEILKKAAAIIKSRAEELAMLIATEGGKPLKDARVEAARAAVTLEEAASAGMGLEGRQWGMQRAAGSENKIAFTIWEPIGVVLAVSAFNHPLNLPCHQAGPAIAAGNTVLLKPATSTPLCSIKLAEILLEAGLPEGVLQVVPAPGAAASALVKSPEVNFLTFIGSAKVGWNLRRIMADGTRMSAEHGGNAASIVMADADLAASMPRIVLSAYYHAGQVCVSTQRLYVEKPLMDDFCAALVEQAAALKVGDARDLATTIGPIIEPEELVRVETWVDEAVANGTRVLLGGGRETDTTYKATVLTNAPEDSKVIAKEVFGPVVTVQPVDSLEEAVTKVNASTAPFQSSIFTQDLDKALYAARKVEASAYMINDMTAFRVDWMPFGGRKHGGLALGGLEHCVRDMSEEKLIVLNPKPPVS